MTQEISIDPTESLQDRFCMLSNDDILRLQSDCKKELSRRARIIRKINRASGMTKSEIHEAARNFLATLSPDQKQILGDRMKVAQ